MPNGRLAALLAVTACLVVVVVVAAEAPAAPDPELSTRIVGGTPAAAGSHPWQVALLSHSVTDRFGAQFCGGTLISPTRVLTAAHCTTGLWSIPGSVDVLVGTTDLRSGGTRIEVSEIVDHPNASVSVPPRSDLSVLKLKSAVTDARPLTLVRSSSSPDDASWGPGAPLTITGWGDISGFGAHPFDLREAQVPRVSDAACAAAYPSAGGRFEAADMLCAAPASGGKDTCQDDSGGPLAAHAVAAPSPFFAGDWRLAGVTSWGAGCALALYPGVYARLGSRAMRDWAVTALAGTEPSNAVAPSLAGAAQVGETLTCEPGAWTGPAATYAYRFERVSPSGSTVIPGVPGASYTLAAQDVGERIGCTVTAAAGTQSVPASAPSVGPVAAAPEATETPTDPSSATDGVVVPAPSPAPPPAPTRGVQDRTPPSLSRVTARCRRSRCTLLISVRDAAPSSGIAHVSATVSVKVRGTTRRRAVQATRRADGRFALTLPRLGTGTYRVALLAADLAGNRRRTATVRRYRLSR